MVFLFQKSATFGFDADQIHMPYSLWSPASLGKGPSLAKDVDGGFADIGLFDALDKAVTVLNQAEVKH